MGLTAVSVEVVVSFVFCGIKIVAVNALAVKLNRDLHISAKTSANFRVVDDT